MDKKADGEQLFTVFVKKHRQATALSLVAVVVTVLFFYWFVDTVAIPVWGNTISFIAVVLFLVTWFFMTKVQDVFKSEKNMRSFNPRSRAEAAVASVVATQENMHFGVARKGVTAYTTGINKTVVVVSETLLSALSPRQAAAVALHEIGHQKNNDLALQLVGVTVQSAVKAANFMALVLLLWHGIAAAIISGPAPVDTFLGDELPIYEVYLQVWAITQIALFIISLLVNFSSRQRELMADSFAVINGYGQELAEALGILTKLAHPDAKIKKGVLARLGNLFETHPLLVARAKNIHNLMSGHEGLIGDTLEFWLVAVAMVVGWIFGLGHILPNEHPALFGVPVIYLVGPVFIWLAYQVITTPFYVTAPDNPKNQLSQSGLAVLGLIMMVLLAITSVTALILAAQQLAVGLVPVGVLMAMLVWLTVREKTAMSKLLLTATAVGAVMFISAAVASLFFVL